MSSGIQWRCVLLWLSVSGLLLACSAAPEPLPATATPLPVPTSLWGQIDLIAQTRQVEAPAVVVPDEAPLLAWTGADDLEARHYTQNEAGVAQIAAIKAFFPFMQTLWPAPDGVHLLWLDRTDASDQLQLLSAFVDRNGVAVLGPNALYTNAVQRYTAQPTATGGLDVVFVSGNVPALYRNQLDAGGRNGIATQLVERADYPVLTTDASGRTWLFWLDSESGDVQRGVWAQGSVETMERLAVRFLLEPTTQLLSFDVAFDSTHTHLFWQVRDGTGQVRLLWSTAALTDDRFSEPRPLPIFQSDLATIEVGFNAGAVAAAGLDETQSAVAWGKPLAGQHNFLPVAVNRGDELGILYFHEGDVVGYQVVGESGSLLRTPQITTDRARNLYLTWSAPQPDGFAELLLTDTRP